MPSDRCDVAGCESEPALYGPSGRRCLAHVPRAMAAPLRSDVPGFVSRDPVRPCVDCGATGQWGPFTCCDPCWDKARERDEAAHPVVRVDEDGCCTTCGRDVQGCYACDDASDTLRRERDEARTRLAEVEYVLAQWPWDGAAALRALRGEPIVRERP